MKDIRRTALKEKLRQKTDAAIEQALSNKPCAQLKTAIDEVENYSKLLASTERGWTRDSLAAAAVAIIVLVSAGILWSYKVKHTNISLVAKTSSVHGPAARDWSLQDPLRGGEVRLYHVSGLRNPRFGISLDDSDGNIWLRLQGAQVVLQTLQLSRGADIDLKCTENELGISINRSRLQGTLWVTGKGALTAGVAEVTKFQKSYDLPVPETFEFSVEAPSAAGVNLHIYAPRQWSFGMLPYTSLTFNYELRSGADREILSGVRSGTLRFNDTSWLTTQLLEGQLLTVPEAEQARIQIRSAGDSMNVTVDGLVGGIMLGNAKGRRELAPSYLEYLYNRKSLLLFWAAVTAGWGLLWGIRKTIFR